MFHTSFGPGLMSGFHLSWLWCTDTDLPLCVSKIVSRGQLVNYFHKSPGEQLWMAFTFEITKELLPSFRIVAYCHANGNEVMSDSAWVDVRDSCMGAVSLTTRHQKKKPSTDHHAHLLTCLIFFFNWVCVVCVCSESLRFVLLAESKRWNRDCLFSMRYWIPVILHFMSLFLWTAVLSVSFSWDWNQPAWRQPMDPAGFSVWKSPESPGPKWNWQHLTKVSVH